MTFSRRAFILASAGAAWTTPLVFAVPRASAASLNSAPPRSINPDKPRKAALQMGDPLPRDLPGDLPWTGQELSKETVLGVSALAAGVALTGLTHEKRTTP